jgi:hypothetical protein
LICDIKGRQIGEVCLRIGCWGSSEEVTREWSSVYYGELRFLIFLTKYCIIRTIKSRRRNWAMDVASMRENRNTCRILVGKPVGGRRAWIRG